MNIQKKTITPFIITLYLSLLALGWAAITIIAHQRNKIVEHILEVESDRFLYFFNNQKLQIDEIYQIVEQWWNQTGSIPTLNVDSGLSVKTQPVNQEKVNQKDFTWQLRSKNQISYFEGSLQKKLINPSNSEELILSVSRSIFPHISPLLNSQIQWVVFDKGGELKSSPFIGKLLNENFEFNELTQLVSPSEDEIAQLVKGSPHIIKKVKLHSSYMLYYFPILVGHEVAAIFGLLYSLDEADQALTSFTALTVAIMSLVSLLLTTFYYLATRRMDQYFNQLRDFTEKVSKGDFSLRLQNPEIEEFKSLNEHLNQMVDSLDRMKEYEEELIVLDRLSSLAQLSSGIAHEIKNPLMVMKYSAGHIKKKEKDQSLVEDIEMIEKNAERIEKVVQRLAEFTRPPISEEREVIDLLDVFTETLYMLRKALENKNIEVRFTRPDWSAKARVQQNAINQVFTNVILNAIEAMPHGGIINVVTSLKKDEEKNDKVVFTINDTGCGIDKESLTRIFNPFFTTKDKGTGLGLAIAYRIIIDHGGFIEISSPNLKREHSLVTPSIENHEYCNDETSGIGTIVIIGIPLEAEQD